MIRHCGAASTTCSSHYRSEDAARINDLNTITDDVIKHLHSSRCLTVCVGLLVRGRCAGVVALKGRASQIWFHSLCGKSWVGCSGEADGGRERAGAGPDRSQVIERSESYYSPEMADVLVVEDQDLGGCVVADGQRIRIIISGNAVERTRLRKPSELLLSGVIAEGKAQG